MRENCNVPRPVYIICSESGSQDLNTGLVSHFQVIEAVQLSQIPMPVGVPTAVPAFIFRATAVWMRNDDDPRSKSTNLRRRFISRKARSKSSNKEDLSLRQESLSTE